MKHLLLAVLAIGLGGQAFAESVPPPIFPVQGMLTDLDGVALDGDADLIFSLYAEEHGGTAFWSEEHLDTLVDEGYFSSYLGLENPIIIRAVGIWRGPLAWHFPQR